jgi:hypothetical protein
MVTSEVNEDEVPAVVLKDTVHGVRITGVGVEVTETVIVPKSGMDFKAPVPRVVFKPSDVATLVTPSAVRVSPDTVNVLTTGLVADGRTEALPVAVAKFQR